MTLVMREALSPNHVAHDGYLEHLFIHDFMKLVCLCQDFSKESSVVEAAMQGRFMDPIH